MIVEVIEEIKADKDSYNFSLELCLPELKNDD